MKNDDRIKKGKGGVSIYRKLIEEHGFVFHGEDVDCVCRGTKGF